MASPAIDVFLLFGPGDRNTYNNKVQPGPNWKGLTADAKKGGYQLTVSGPAFQLSVKVISDSLTNSEATILVGHGAGSFQGKKFVSSQIKLTDGLVLSPDGLYEVSWNGNVFTPIKKPTAKIKTNRVTGLFTCNSHETLPKAFEVPAGDSLVTNDGGADGETRLGTLENSAYAFVKEYVRSKGDVTKSLAKAQGAMNAGGKGFVNDKGDKLMVE